MLILVPTFLLFERVHTVYIQTLVEYVLLVPDSIARAPGRLAGLLASDSGTVPRIEPNLTQADLFTTKPLRQPNRHALLSPSWQGCVCPDWQELCRRRPAVAAARLRLLQLPARRHQWLPQQQSFGV